MFIDWTIPLFIGLVGGPLTVIFRFWYKKKGGDNSSKFADNGTYVRDDSLYSYDESGTSSSVDNENNKKNNS
ncbi:MAG: hypothetical protein WAN47_01385 [Nitrosotalea sp.]